FIGVIGSEVHRVSEKRDAGIVKPLAHCAVLIHWSRQPPLSQIFARLASRFEIGRKQFDFSDSALGESFDDDIEGIGRARWAGHLTETIGNRPQSHATRDRVDFSEKRSIERNAGASSYDEISSGSDRHTASK